MDGWSDRQTDGQMDRWMDQWTKGATKRGVELRSMMQEKALIYAKEIGLHDFAASDGWLIDSPRGKVLISRNALLLVMMILNLKLATQH